MSKKGEKEKVNGWIKGKIVFSTTGERDEPLRVASELVEKDCNPIYGATALEMSLYLLWRCAVIHIAHKDTPGIDVFPILTQTLRLLVQRCLHLPQFGGF